MFTLRNWLHEASKNLHYTECVYIAQALFETQILALDEQLQQIPNIALNLALQKRIQHIPLAKIVEKKYFYKHCFVTNQFTLDPRSETEELINKISIKPRSILELGIGSGCLILSVMKLFPKAIGLGVDISNEALKIANENAEILGIKVGKKFNTIQNNWADKLSGKFDLVLCNPPYVDTTYVDKTKLSKETLNDPHLALFGSEKTFQDIFESLKNIEFMQAIFEVPEYLITPIEKLLQKYSTTLRYNKYTFEEIYDSKIFTLNILR